MNFQYIVIGIGLFFICVFLMILFLSPTEGKLSRKDKKELDEKEAKHKDWEKQALHLGEEVKSLRQEMTALKKTLLQKEKESAVEKIKGEKLWEKLKQEREWHGKEQEKIDTSSRELKTLKHELVKVQEQHSTEHTTTLRLERDVKTLSEELGQSVEQRRKLEAENAQLKARIENYRLEIAQLKKDNAQLAEKKDEASWIARSEYDRVVKLLKEKK